MPAGTPRAMWRSSADDEPASRSCSCRRARASRRWRGRRSVTPSRNAERQGWAGPEVVDMRKALDPARTGLTPTHGRLLAPRASGARAQHVPAGLDCSRCVARGERPRASGAVPPSCNRAPTSSARGARRCGRRCASAVKTPFRNLRAGVTVPRGARSARSEEVVDVTADGDDCARPASTSAPRRRCTESSTPTQSRSSTSTRSCWHPATELPRRRSPCSHAPHGSSADAAPVRVCACRPASEP